MFQQLRTSSPSGAVAILQNFPHSVESVDLRFEIWDWHDGPRVEDRTNLNNFLAKGESSQKASFRLSVMSFIYFFYGRFFQKFRDWHNRQDSVSSLTGSIYISHALSRKADHQTKWQVLSRSRSIVFAVQKTWPLPELYLLSKLFLPSTKQCSGCRSCTQKECEWQSIARQINTQHSPVTADSMD